MRILRFVRGLATSKNRDFFFLPLLLPLYFNRATIYRTAIEEQREKKRGRGVSVKRRVKDGREGERGEGGWNALDGAQFILNALIDERTCSQWVPTPWTRLSDKARFSELLDYPFPSRAGKSVFFQRLCCKKRGVVGLFYSLWIVRERGEKNICPDNVHVLLSCCLKWDFFRNRSLEEIGQW